MNKGVVAVIAAMALLGCVSGQLLNLQALTPGSLATLALLPPLINQLSMPVRPPPPPPFFGGMGAGFGMAPYYQPTIIHRTIRHHGGKGGYY